MRDLPSSKSQSIAEPAWGPRSRARSRARCRAPHAADHLVIDLVHDTGMRSRCLLLTTSGTRCESGPAAEMVVGVDSRLGRAIRTAAVGERCMYLHGGRHRWVLVVSIDCPP
jgi:hypothetical protein